MSEQVAVDEVAGMVDRLIELSSVVGDDAAGIDMIAAAERLKAAAAAFQLEKITQFARSQAEAKTAMGFEARHAMRGVPEQIGLATKVSPSAAARQLTRARALTEHLPDTFALLRRGEVSELVATHVVNETSHLAADDRRGVDRELAAQLPTLGPRRAQGLARTLAIAADPAGAAARASHARKDRRVSVRPAPDTMTTFSALLPCEQGVAAYAALRRHADTLVAAGDARSRQQIMADTLVERVTGQATADAVTAEIGLVMTDASLLFGDNEPAQVTDYGPIPAETARTLLEQARVFLRRLFTDPATGIVTDCDPRRRRFDGTLARLLIYRDGRCRDPFCDAPIRHIDHIQPHAAGGPTTPVNGRGTCERGNHTRQLPGWTIRLIDPSRYIVETITPTGHRYQSRPPSAPGAQHRQHLRAEAAGSRAA
ncbi:HNH endonuclease [Phytoactinopolyspora mesophila]|uniref:DUF222 domain-containing protein n=1 Tax=Phytoactinopolyspora mesophila TaxID=2650750 RepID=A0A7K3LZ08_9ACTN|nr:DUF222 domain-containing protein [Phytoactinopolyspora mesophila]NDL56256.1 DUF222 domain-containing protein [Phytoactinopolyspora mesophila]